MVIENGCLVCLAEPDWTALGSIPITPTNSNANVLMALLLVACSTWPGRYGLQNQETSRLSPVSNSDIKAVRKSIAAYKCLLKTPSFLSIATQLRKPRCAVIAQ